LNVADEKSKTSINSKVSQKSKSVENLTLNKTKSQGREIQNLFEKFEEKNDNKSTD